MNEIDGLKRIEEKIGSNSSINMRSEDFARIHQKLITAADNYEEKAERTYFIKKLGILFTITSVCLLALLFTLSNIDIWGGNQVITDQDTSPVVATLKIVDSKLSSHHYGSDNMDRGNHDYSDKTVVIDTNYSDIFRGDVAFFEDNGIKLIARVVALPGETIEIIKGQIFIDNKKLDTFYGKAHRAGLDKATYFEEMDKGGYWYNKEVMMDIFEFDMDEMKLSNNEYYVVSDDWLRGSMYLLQKDKIIGKVLGYKE